MKAAYYQGEKQVSTEIWNRLSNQILKLLVTVSRLEAVPTLMVASGPAAAGAAEALVPVTVATEDWFGVVRMGAFAPYAAPLPLTDGSDAGVVPADILSAGHAAAF